MGSKISCSTCNPKPINSQNTRSSRDSHSLRRDGHVLRLWAEVFHVSASSGAVRWTQLSDDLVPITVTVVQNRYHVTAYNSRVDKVLDTWLSATRLGQASNCFVYWKDSISGDTWGLNFTSATDARAFRECISASRDFRRAESSYSLREGHVKDKTAQSRSQTLRPSSERQQTSHSQPNSPSKQKYLQQLSTRDANQCTCDCMTSDALHKQRNGRIRYSTFTRQDSSGTTQSSKSDGSLVRRQHERQQYFANRGHVRSMEDQIRQKAQRESATRAQQIATQSRRQQDDSRPQTTTNANQLRSKSQEDIRRVATTATTTDDLINSRTTTTTAQTLSSEALKRMLRDVTTTTTQDRQQQHHDRPKSLSEVTQSSSGSTRDSIDRSRSHRSLEGRRRSLERSQCVDFTDASPPTPRHRQQQQRDVTSVLEDYESELRRCLASQSSRESNQTNTTTTDAIDVFESLLKESMDDVQCLMREVQNELSIIRAEEKRFKSLSTQSLIQLSRSSAPILDTLSIDGQLPFCSATGYGGLPFGSQSLLTPFPINDSFVQSIGSIMTSSEVSDDEKASLTTAISDEDDLDLRESPLRTRSGSSAANFECLGSVRKSGFLSVKKWLLRKRHSLELARKRGWKGYWVCLKGTTLLFYNCESRDGHAIDSQPKHLIFVDLCLVQSIPEHPKRDHVFCLSTAFGDAYLLDAPCLLERDSWIAAIHCACAAQLARNSGKLAAGHVLSDEIQRLEHTIEHDLRSRHEQELLLTCISDDKQKQQLVSGIMCLDEKVEKTRTEIFRLKCYGSALTNDESPNPKTILSLVNRRTKSQLNRLGVFTVSSLHAFNCAKNPSIVGNLLKRQKSEEKESATATLHDDKLIEVEVLLTATGERRRLEVSQSWTADDLLLHLMGNHVNAREYYVSQSSRVLLRNELLSAFTTDATFDIIPKVLFTIELSRDSNDVLFGFSVESELIANDLIVYVSRVESESIAAAHALKRYDELVVINGALVADLDMMFVESVLQEELQLCLMIRSTTARQMTANDMTATAEQQQTSDAEMMQTTDDLIESLVCPPPPSVDQNHELISDCQLDSLIVPKVESFLPKTQTTQQSSQSFESQLIHFQQQNRQQLITTEDDTTQPTQQTKQIKTTNEEKMKKVVKELIDTEITYCLALEQLMTLYLEPLSHSSLLTQQDIKVLFGSIVSIIRAQKEFKNELQIIASETGGEGKQLNIESIAKCFLNHSKDFRNYSTFCASHSRAVKLLADEKTALHDWLLKRSSGQLAQSLESFLIKPIQRVLKYPLLLSQMKGFCAKDSKEYQKLNEALKAMEKVAEHINEMQRIHEEYGAIFEHLARNYSRNNTENKNIDLSPQALIHYGGVQWLNSMEFLGKNCRKGVELHSMCFVFSQFVCFLCKETVRHSRQSTIGSKSRALRSADVEIIRHQTLIPVIEVQVRACAQQDNDFKWELIQLKTNCGKRSEKIYKLSNSSCEYRNAFLRTIRQIIREDVQKMSTKQMPIKSCEQQIEEQKPLEMKPLDDSLSTVSCGLCGKDVSIGCREQRHASIAITTNSSNESPVWKRRQDSSSR